MKYVFGPVPSRRLGQSLGIDPIPAKTCNWNCVYCQLGRTSPPVNERRVYAPADELVAEVRATLQAEPPPRIDWLTFVGSGEPTLHIELGWMLRQLKSLTEIPVAVITNGSLLSLPEVRQDLAPADLVMPSLDAGSERLYRRINRAMPELSLERLITGLAEFRDSFRGRLWIEVMLIQGSNTHEAALRDLAAALARVRPDEVHINLPVRLPAEPWVEVADEASVARAVHWLGAVARVVPPAGGELQLAGCDDVVEAILGVIGRHPLSEEELLRALSRWDETHVAEALEQLRASGRARVVHRRGQRFWTGAEGRYGDPSTNRCQDPQGGASP